MGIARVTLKFMTGGISPSDVVCCWTSVQEEENLTVEPQIWEE